MNNRYLVSRSRFIAAAPDADFEVLPANLEQPLAKLGA
jgi:hypothetical protein